MRKFIVGTILSAVIVSGFVVYGAFASVDIIPADEYIRLSNATREYDYNTWTRPDVRAVIEMERSGLLK
jgi:hypothetical protein